MAHIQISKSKTMGAKAHLHVTAMLPLESPTHIAHAGAWISPNNGSEGKY